MKKLRLSFLAFQRFLSKLPGFSNPEKYSLGFLNATQFFGALNDNIYKLALIFFLIEVQGTERANTILSAAGALFVIPFLLFSSAAGVLADRYSKNRLIIIAKMAEVVTFTGVILAFAFKQVWLGYSLLFCLSTHSAFFSPSKFGIIPELVPKTKVSKANGLITSFTYLAIILGTFCASFLTQMTEGNYIFVGLFCFMIAGVGLLTSLGIKHTPAKKSTKKIDPFFVREIIQTFSHCRRIKHLQIAIVGAAYFLFIGAFTQLNIIPYAMNSLGLSKEMGGYLFLTTALGIAAGSVIAGRASKKRVELGLSCVCGLVLAVLLVFLSLSTHSLFFTIVWLFFLGLCGGGFIVPLDTFIQLSSPEEERGRVIATTNFLSFTGVLVASISIFLFNESLALPAAISFRVVGAITFLFSLYLLLRLSDFFLSYMAKKILFNLIPMRTENLRLLHKATKPVLMLENGSWFKAWLLCGIVPQLHLLIPQYRVRQFPWFERLFFSIHRIDSPQKFEDLVNKGKMFLEEGGVPCIYLKTKKPIPEKYFSFSALLSRKQFEVLSVRFDKVDKTTIVRFDTH